jgi:UrcA family protein
MLKSVRPRAPYISFTLACLALSSPAILFAGPAAPSSDDVPTVKVSYAGLDLASPDGAEILYRRLKGAAERVCGPLDRRNLSQLARWSACYDKALSDALSHVNQEQVTALDRQRRRGRSPAVVLAHHDSDKVSGDRQ